MNDTERFNSQLQLLSENKVITDPEKNLRSKMESLIRSIENLTAKKLRIEYEIKVQKRSLARKRMELKKSTKHLKVNLESALDSGLLTEDTSASGGRSNVDDLLFRESARILDQD